MVPHITITPPKLKRSLSLNSADPQLAYKQNKETEDGKISPSNPRDSNGPSESLQNSSESSFGNNYSSLSGRARKKEVVSNPITTTLMRSSMAGDITQDPDQFHKDGQKQHQNTGKLMEED